MANESVESKPSLGLLGVTLDDRLSYSAHMNNVCKKAGKKVGVSTRLRNLVPRNALLQLQKSAVLQNLTYRHTVWHFCLLMSS